MIREINNDLILVIVNLSTGIIPNPCQIIEDSRTSFPIWFKRYFSRAFDSNSELLNDYGQFSTKDQTLTDKDTKNRTVLFLSGRADRQRTTLFSEFPERIRTEDRIDTETIQSLSPDSFFPKIWTDPDRGQNRDRRNPDKREPDIQQTDNTQDFLKNLDRQRLLKTEPKMSLLDQDF